MRFFCNVVFREKAPREVGKINKRGGKTLQLPSVCMCVCMSVCGALGRLIPLISAHIHNKLVPPLQYPPGEKGDGHRVQCVYGGHWTCWPHLDVGACRRGRSGSGPTGALPCVCWLV